MKNTNHDMNDDLSLMMKVTLGTTVVSLVTAFSTHHMATQSSHASNEHHVATTADVSHLFEREREVLHSHSNLSRTRYATMSGANG